MWLHFRWITFLSPIPSHSTDSSFSHSVPDLVFESEEDYFQDCRGEREQNVVEQHPAQMQHFAALLR